MDAEPFMQSVVSADSSERAHQRVGHRPTVHAREGLLRRRPQSGEHDAKRVGAHQRWPVSRA
jgi:hypothetical protein